MFPCFNSLPQMSSVWDLWWKEESEERQVVVWSDNLEKKPSLVPSYLLWTQSVLYRANHARYKLDLNPSPALGFTHPEACGAFLTNLGTFLEEQWVVNQLGCWQLRPHASMLLGTHSLCLSAWFSLSSFSPAYQPPLGERVERNCL